MNSLFPLLCSRTLFEKKVMDRVITCSILLAQPVLSASGCLVKMFLVANSTSLPDEGKT